MENIILNNFLPMLFSPGGLAYLKFYIPISLMILFSPVWIFTFPICWISNYFFIDIAAEKCNYIFENKKSTTYL